jgi:hypothetical protein
MSEFQGLKLLEDRKLTLPEMIRAVRKSMAEEIRGAIELYQQFAEAGDNEKFVKVMTEV